LADALMSRGFAAWQNALVAKPSWAAYTCKPVDDEIVNGRPEPE
jgi:hypothetical protein